MVRNEEMGRKMEKEILCQSEEKGIIIYWYAGVDRHAMFCQAFFHLPAAGKAVPRRGVSLPGSDGTGAIVPCLPLMDEDRGKLPHAAGAAENG